MSTALPPERAGTAAPDDLAAMRAGLAGAVAAGMFSVDPVPEVVTLGGVEALRFVPEGRPRGIVLHCHGGGFRLGCPEQVAPFAAALAEAAGVTVVCPRYRLAPEHPFPAGLNDARAVLGALQGELPIVVSGDSAGGGIAAGLTALAVEQKLPLAGLMLLSPWLDLTVSRSSFDTNATTDPLFSRASAQAAAALYLQDLPADHPLASPVLGKITGYPPTFVNVGNGEVLLDDARALYARLVGVDVAARLQIVPGMDHVAVTRGANLPGSPETFAAIVAFLNGVLSAR